MSSEYEIEVDVYVAEDGRAPFTEWPESLGDREAAARIRFRLARVRLGNFGVWRSVGGGVMELKVDVGPGYRMYFGQFGSRLVILLCGGSKKTQRRDIVKAKTYWADYRRRTDETEPKLS
jgi:putative addiction module killer protein